MSGQKRNNIPLTQHGVITEEAMLAYLKGELSPENTAQFEQLIANDPFAREAIEGLQTANANALKSTFAEITQKVAEKTGAEKPVKTISFSGVARYAVAAILIGALIGFAFLITNYFNKQANQMALNEETQPTPPAEAAPLFEEKSIPLDGDTTVAEAQVMESQDAIAQEDEIAAKSKTESIQAVKTDGASSTSLAINQPSSSSTSSATLAAKNTDEKAMAVIQSERGAKETKAKQSKVAAGVAPKPNTAVNADAEKKEAAVASPTTPVSTTPAKPTSTNDFSDDALDKLPDNMDAAMESFNNRNYKAAAKQFGKIADKDPANWDAVYFEGISQFINGDNNKALKNFDKLLDKGVKHTDGAKWYKAQILLKKGKKDEAKKLLNELKASSGNFKDRAINKLQELE